MIRLRVHHVASALLCAMASASALAQDGQAAPEPASFASAFFYSTKLNPAGGEPEIELFGSFLLWLLLALSATSIGLIGVLFATNQRKSVLPESVVAEVERLVDRNDYRVLLEMTSREASFFSAVLNVALRDAPLGHEAMIRGLETASEQLTTNLLRRTEYLNVLGQVAPMIGLFGTVWGMILAFHSIVVAGGNADPVLLAGGIGTALTTTFWGLIIAIPALSAYAVLRNRIDAMTAEATLRAEEIVNRFRPGAAGAASK